MSVLILGQSRGRYERPRAELGLDWSQPITNGLASFVDERNGFDYARRAMSTFTGTLRRGAGIPAGSLTRGYGATMGASTTDLMTLPSQGMTTDLTWSVWMWRNGAPNPAPRILETNLTHLLWSVSGSAMQYSRGTDTQPGTWQFSGAGATGVWIHIVVTHQGIATPTIYVNGVVSTLSVIASPTGSPTTTAGTVYVGNRNGSDRNWDGMISTVARWTRALSAGEVWSLYDPATRWDLYWQPSRRSYAYLASARSPVMALWAGMGS